MHRCNQLGGRGFNIYKNVKQINPGKGDRGSSKTLRERGVNKLLSHLISTALLNSLPPFVFFSDWNYSGVYIKFVIHILPPPPYWFKFLRKNVQSFFCILSSQLGKSIHIFYKLGEKYGGIKQKNMHPWKIFRLLFLLYVFMSTPFPSIKEQYEYILHISLCFKELICITYLIFLFYKLECPVDTSIIPIVFVLFLISAPDCLVLKLFKKISALTPTTSVSDPYHLAGSGSTSGNVDPDPGSKK